MYFYGPYKKEANFRVPRTIQILGKGNGLLSPIVATCAYNCNICVSISNNARLYSDPFGPRVKLASVQVRVKF